MVRLERYLRVALLACICVGLWLVISLGRPCCLLAQRLPPLVWVVRRLHRAGLAHHLWGELPGHTSAPAEGPGRRFVRSRALARALRSRP